MSLWRSKVLDDLREGEYNPDEKRFEKIRGADNPMMLWIELRSIFEDAHRNNEDSLIRLIYGYAIWCVSDAPKGTDAGHDPPTAAVVSFYEHLPINPLVRKRIHEFMSWEQVDGMKNTFRYFLNEDEYARLMSELRDKYKTRKTWSTYPP